MSVYDKLNALNITLSAPATPAAAYVMYAQTGNLVFLSGHISKNADGTVNTGLLGKDKTTEQGKAAARAVLETGEFDYAWNTQLAPDVIAGMEAAGKGKNVAAFGSLVERIHVNLTDPSPGLPEGERSTVKHPHPILTDPAVRKALSMAIDRELLTEIGYGPAGQPTSGSKTCMR